MNTLLPIIRRQRRASLADAPLAVPQTLCPHCGLASTDPVQPLEKTSKTKPVKKLKFDDAENTASADTP